MASASDIMERMSFRDLLRNGNASIVERLIKKYVPISTMRETIEKPDMNLETLTRNIPEDIQTIIVEEYNKIVREKCLNLIINAL